MQVLQFPGCCTAKVIVGFGEEAAASYRADREYTDRSMAQELDRLIRGPQIGSRMGSVVVQLTSRQQRGIRVLGTLGFKSTVAQPKDNHSDTSLYTLTLNPREYINRVRNINELYPDPAPYTGPKLLVKNMKPECRKQYQNCLRQARSVWWNDLAAARYQEQARLIKEDPNNYITP